MIDTSSKHYTSFKARKVQTTRINTKKIDIYALNNTDSFFIERMKDISDFYTFPKDSLKFGGETENDVLKEALNSVPNKRRCKNQVLIAIENDSKICGILSLKKKLHYGSNNATISNMITWQDTDAARKALLLAAINIHHKIYLSTANITQPIFRFFKKLGGTLSDNCKNLIINSTKNIDIFPEQISTKRNAKLTMLRNHQSPIEYNLEEILKIN